MTIRSSTSSILSTFDATGTKAPKAVTDMKARLDKLAAAAAAVTPAADTFTEAVADALLADRDPRTDPDVLAAVVGQQIRSSNTAAALDVIAYRRLADVMAEHADEIVETWRKPFDAAAKALHAAHNEIGDKPLDDSAAILRLGGDIAEVWANARQANKTIDTIAHGWACLGEISGRASLTTQHRVLRIADVPPRQARDYRNVKLTPWEVVTKGMTLSLPTFDEWHAREASVAHDTHAIQREADQQWTDAARQQYGFATA